MDKEYDFDYRKARPNRFAVRADQTRGIVVLDPDVSEVFTTSESVNAVLRALIDTMPEVSQRIDSAPPRVAE
jgi:regulator of sirC expression with transglutaminase-like and TPR domain